MSRPFDILVYGATGYTGTITCEYIASKRNNEKWAIAGRNKEKLESLKKELVKINPVNEDVEIIVVDATKSFDAVKDMVSKAKVCISFVGPYRKYGEPIVKACVECGTHYVDATGEPPFVQEIIDKYHEEAKKKKLYMLPAAGIGSLIPDVGVEIMKEEFEKKEHSKVVSAKGYMKYNGRYAKTFSNGTWGTFINSMANKAPRRAAKSGVAAGSGKKKPRAPRVGTHYYSRNKTWAVPFVEGADLSIVRRSNELNESKTGSEDFVYSQFTQFPRFPPLYLIFSIITVMILMFFARFAFIRSFLLKQTDPAGGPTKEQRADASIEFFVDAVDDQKRKKRLHLKSPVGPYDTTGFCCAEAAFAIANDKLEPVYGIVTPASCMSSAIQKRLKERSSVTWQFE